QLALELGVALAQHRYLPFHERDGEAARLMGQPELQEQRRMAFEEVGMAQEVGGNRFLGNRFTERGLALLLTHSSIWPSYTIVVGPLCHSGEPGPAHRTLSVPPFRTTVTRSASRPHRRPTATAAAAPVPQASVSPAPRS